MEHVIAGDMIDLNTRAELFRQWAITAFSGAIITCSGWENDDMCPQLGLRNSSKCAGCGAIDILNNAISALGKGKIKKT